MKDLSEAAIDALHVFVGGFICSPLIYVWWNYVGIGDTFNAPNITYKQALVSCILILFIAPPRVTKSQIKREIENELCKTNKGGER